MVDKPSGRFPDRTADRPFVRPVVRLNERGAVQTSDDIRTWSSYLLFSGAKRITAKDRDDPLNVIRERLVPALKSFDELNSLPRSFVSVPPPLLSCIVVVARSLGILDFVEILKFNIENLKRRSVRCLLNFCESCPGTYLPCTTNFWGAAFRIR